jgi:hypothetical protein
LPPAKFNKAETLGAIGPWSNKGKVDFTPEIRSSNGKVRGKSGYRPNNASALPISAIVVSFRKVAALTAWIHRQNPYGLCRDQRNRDHENNGDRHDKNLFDRSDRRDRISKGNSLAPR